MTENIPIINGRYGHFESGQTILEGARSGGAGRRHLLQVKVTGVEGAEPNHGRLGVKGRFGYDFIYSDEGLTTPLIRENDRTFTNSERRVGRTAEDKAWAVRVKKIG